MKFFAVILAVTFFCSSCASMFSGTSETLYVRSDEKNTKFYVDNREIGIGTNAVVSLPKKGLSRKMLRAEKDGCTPKSIPIETKFDSMSLLGLLIDWGLVSMLVVDLGATGAIHKAAQTDYNLTPDCGCGDMQRQGRVGRRN